jgi:hypothetical protein
LDSQKQTAEELREQLAEALAETTHLKEELSKSQGLNSSFMLEKFIEENAPKKTVSDTSRRNSISNTTSAIQIFEDERRLVRSPSTEKPLALTQSMSSDSPTLRKTDSKVSTVLFASFSSCR